MLRQTGSRMLVEFRNQIRSRVAASIVAIRFAGRRNAKATAEVAAQSANNAAEVIPSKSSKIVRQVSWQNYMEIHHKDS